MPTDLGLISTWPQAVVALAIIFAVAVAPALFTYLNNRIARETRDELGEVKRTLTEKNGGKSVIDRFDQLEQMVSDRLDESDARAKQIGKRVRRIEEWVQVPEPDPSEAHHWRPWRRGEDA